MRKVKYVRDLTHIQQLSETTRKELRPVADTFKFQIIVFNYMYAVLHFILLEQLSPPPPGPPSWFLPKFTLAIILGNSSAAQ